MRGPAYWSVPPPLIKISVIQLRHLGGISPVIPEQAGIQLSTLQGFDFSIEIPACSGMTDVDDGSNLQTLSALSTTGSIWLYHRATLPCELVRGRCNLFLGH